MSHFAPLTSPDHPTGRVTHSMANGTLTVNYRVGQDGIVQPTGLAQHFTAENEHSIVKIDAKSAQFEKLSAKPEKTSSWLVMLARGLPVAAGMLTVIVLLASIFRKQREYMETIIALIWAGVNIPFCIYQIIAGFVGRVNYPISFGVTIILALGSVAETVLCFMVQDLVGGPLVLVVALLHIANAIVLGLVAHIRSRCGKNEENYMTNGYTLLED